MNDQQNPTTANTAPSSSKVKLILLAVGIVLLLTAGYLFDFPKMLQQALAWIQGLGVVGYAVFALLYIVASVFFIPGTILTLGAGFIYGVVLGSVIVSISSTLGAGVAFLIGRYFARGLVEKKIESNSSFKAIDESIAREGGKIVFLIRLSPAFPFNLLNYAFGLTRVRFFSYLMASWLGMLPGTVMYVYLGSLGGDLATLGAGEQASSPMEWVLKGVGLLATIIVTIYVTKMARNALRSKVDDPVQSPAG